MRFILAIGTVALVFMSSVVISTPASAATCEYVLGFKAIHDAIPDKVGDCLVNEHHNPTNGDGLQESTAWHGKGGLLVWRKADNWTAFTDGANTWVNGPNGLQMRSNAQRFVWENDGQTPPPPPAPVQASIQRPAPGAWYGAASYKTIDGVEGLTCVNFNVVADGPNSYVTDFYTDAPMDPRYPPVHVYQQNQSWRPRAQIINGGFSLAPSFGSPFYRQTVGMPSFSGAFISGTGAVGVWSTRTGAANWQGRWVAERTDDFVCNHLR